jgi:transposase
VRLKKMAYGHKTEHRLRVRAQVVLHAARGRSNACIARETGLHLDTVRRWRGRFAQAGLAWLKTVNAAREAARRGIAPFMSASTVRRWLAQVALDREIAAAVADGMKMTANLERRQEELLGPDARTHYGEHAERFDGRIIALEDGSFWAARLEDSEPHACPKTQRKELRALLDM